MKQLTVRRKSAVRRSRPILADPDLVFQFRGSGYCYSVPVPYWWEKCREWLLFSTKKRDILIHQRKKQKSALWPREIALFGIKLSLFSYIIFYFPPDDGTVNPDGGHEAGD